MKTICMTLGAMAIAALGFSQTNPNYVDFEPGTYSGVHNPTAENTPINNAYFLSAYSVEFKNVTSGGGLVDPKYAKIGSPARAFANTNNPLINTNCGVPSPSGHDNPYASTTATGCWFMTDDDGVVQQNPNPLRIEYYDEDIRPCTTASGYLYDLDGSSTAEAWKLEIYSLGNSTPDNTIYLVSDQYSSCTGCPPLPGGATIYNTISAGVYEGGDGASTYWEMQTNGGPIDFILMSYVGHPSRNVGVAFDNFYYCSAAERDCIVDAAFTYDVRGCGVQFYATPAIGFGTEIIGYHWDFGDGTTSNEMNPFHTYPAGSFQSVTLTITGYNGQECCTDRYSFEGIEVGDCEPCQGDVNFRFSADACDPCIMDFDAVVTNNTSPIIGYYWTVNGNVAGTSQSIQHQLTGPSTVCLTVIFEGERGEEDCCTQTVCWDVDCGEEGMTEGHSGKKAVNEPNQADPEDGAASPDPNNRLRTYPNPSDGQMTIELESDQSDQVSIEIISARGVSLLRQEGLSLQSGHNQWPVSTADLADGVYILKVRGSSTNLSRKITISH